MPEFTPMNVEGSVGRYLADNFLSLGFKIYWKDTEQKEGTGDIEITILRDFPPEATLLAPQSSTPKEGIVRVPAFTVFADLPRTEPEDRTGIGESTFDRTMSVSIDGFADTEETWYKFQSYFRDWLDPDIRMNLYDYQQNINSGTYTPLEQKMQFTSTQIIRRELSFNNAARYYLFVSTTAKYVE